MSDIIHLLPDNIANQIAAGEVIQRPASAVKELLENAVDAGATQIELVVNEAGKALVQVIDNGKGMSETDARLCFERHATSKIRNIQDLFHIKTMGFRGEALASIAAVAQVEMKTIRPGGSGTRILIENSKVSVQEPVAWQQGTSIAMKNLFFNVPARRNFLKSNPVELRHIIEEFNRVAMAFPEIAFTFLHNNMLMMRLEKGTLKQRILQILGSNYASKLTPVKEQTDYMNISGFIGKPETAKKSRGDQYFFVNNRFIKSPFLNHAVAQGFEGLIARDSYPAYVLYIDLDPAHVDINVHPTKQEIKFEDEKIIYAFVKSAVKHALAQFSISPTLDFELDPQIQELDAVAKPFTEEQRQSAQRSSLFSTFTRQNQAHFIESSSDLREWKSFFRPAESTPTSVDAQPLETKTEERVDTAPQQIKIPQQEPDTQQAIQLLNTYLLLPVEYGFLLIHQQNAHERILYERFSGAVTGKAIPVQQSLFPVTLEIGATDVALLHELLSDLHVLGFRLEPFGKNTFIIHGTPADFFSGSEKNAIEEMLEQFKHFTPELRFSNREKLLRSMAAQQAIKGGKALSHRECGTLIEELFACEMPGTTPNGKPTYTTFRKEELSKIFGRG